LFNKIKSFFKNISLKEEKLEVQYILDYIENKNISVIQIFYKINNKTIKIRSIDEIGYNFNIIEQDIKYQISYKDFEKIKEIKMLSSKISENGDIELNIIPDFLKYLRQDKNIKETISSKTIKINKTKYLKNTLKIDYIPNKKLKIKNIYKHPINNKSYSKAFINENIKNNYVKIDNEFIKIENSIKENISKQEYKKYFEDDFISIDLKDIPYFFAKDLIYLKSKIDIFPNESFEKIKIIRKKFKPNIKINEKERGWLDFEVGYSIGDFDFNQDSFKNENDEYVKVNEYNFIKIDKEKLKEVDEFINKLNSEKTENGYRIPKEKFMVLEEAINKIGGIKTISEKYKKFLDELTNFSVDENFAFNSNIEKFLDSKNIILRSYQRAGIHWLNWLNKSFLHGILADDMGLGKTLQTIIMLSIDKLENNSSLPTIILCPKSVIKFWYSEINNFFYNKPKLIVYSGYNRDKNIWKNSKTKNYIFILTYETLSIDIKYISKIKYNYIILDEATKIKNNDTTLTKATKLLLGLHRIALTGTPIENNITDLWSLFDFLMKGHLGNYSRFSKLINTDINSIDNKFDEVIKRKIKPFVLRRLKSVVAKDLPKKIEEKLICNLTLLQKKLYNKDVINNITFFIKIEQI